jgi:heat-inducible transcriptional repressor
VNGSLPERSEKILREVVRLHIRTGEPVGSASLVALDCFDVSAATLRSVMSDLEERGYLFQPHTSAGRVPTDRGYRHFVDHLADGCELAPDEQQLISRGMVSMAGEIRDMMQGTSLLLSRFSNLVGIVIGPDKNHMLFHQMEFILLAPRKVLVVMVSPSGVITNRMIDVEEEYDQEELERFSRFLADEYAGWSLSSVRDHMSQRLTEESVLCDRLVESALSLGRLFFSGLDEDSEIFLEGTANMLRTPEFAENRSIRVLLEAIEQKSKLVTLLNSCLEQNDVSIVIGSESRMADFGACSVVSSPFSLGDRVIGSVGVLGPKRMEYSRMIGLVGNIANQFSTLIGRTVSLQGRG